MKKIPILVFIFSISIMLVMIPNLDHSSGDSGSSPTIKLSESMTDWHDGTDQSTDELTLEYKEQYDYFDGNNDGIDDGCFRQKMDISYKDNTGTYISFNFIHEFSGCIGIDVDNRTVTDWNERDNLNPALITFSLLPPEYGLGGRVHSETWFEGFKIYNGSSADLNITKIGEYPNSWNIWPDEQDWLADLKFRNSSMRIGQVTLDTEDYSSNGTNSIKSIVKFDIHINATIGIETNKEVIDATLSYTINHTVDYTRFKYGLDIDWSNAKDFATMGSINEGDPYCLMFLDHPLIATYADGIEQTAIYNTNDENDTAIFEKDGNLLSEYKTVKTYNLKGDPTPLNTVREYYEKSGYDKSMNGSYSNIFVFFDGFIYNQSIGLECDPTLIIYSGESFGIPGYNIFFLIGVISVVVIFRIKRLKIK